jgi:hypothetical protein
MSQSARSITVFGVYLALAGLAFMFVPNLLLPIIGFPTTNEIWIRLVGLLTLILGMYFLYSVRYNNKAFFRATLIARLMFFSGVILFVILGWASPLLILFGLVDLVGAGWTWWALRAEGA